MGLVKHDVGGNIDRVAARAAAKPAEYEADVFAMVRDDVAAGTHTISTSVTKGLLWLKRCATGVGGMSVGAAAAGAGDVQRPTELQRRWRRRDACAWSRPAVTFTHATCTCSPWLCVCLQGHGVRCSAAGEAVHRPAADPEPGGRAGRVHTKGSVRGQGRSWVAAAEGPRWRRGAAWPAAHPTLGLLTVCQTSQAPLAARHMPPYCLTPPSALRRSCAAPAAAGGQRNVLCHVAALPRLDRDGHLHPGPQDRAQQVGRGAVAAARRAAARAAGGVGLQSALPCQARRFPTAASAPTPTGPWPQGGFLCKGGCCAQRRGGDGGDARFLHRVWCCAGRGAGVPGSQRLGRSGKGVTCGPQCAQDDGQPGAPCTMRHRAPAGGWPATPELPRL